jgi:ABC-type Fe3+ transport system permease subunit
MPLKWRWCLVVVLAATVLGGFMPRALLTDSRAPVTNAAFLVEELPMAPSGCADATCGKGAPAPATPTILLAAAAAVTAAAMGLALAGRTNRRLRARAATLPSGNALRRFHPPQFS